MSFFKRKKKKQLESEWQIVDVKKGESLLDALERLTQGALSAKKPIHPPSDGEWLMTAALNKLSLEATYEGLDAVRHARKVGVN